MSLLSGCIGVPSGSKAWPSQGAFTRTGHLERASAETPDASYIPCESALKVHGCRIELEEQEQPAFPTPLGGYIGVSLFPGRSFDHPLRWGRCIAVV